MAENLPALAPVRLPIGGLDENRAIDLVADWISTARHRMETEFSRTWLETELRKGLREGRLTLTLRAVEAANLDDEIADAALRAVFAEMAGAGGKLPEQGPGYPQVWAYGQGAVLRDTHKRRGHRWHDNWMRDIQICHLIVLACHEFCLRPTRNRATRRANSTPSGISIVVAGLARHGIHRDESSIQQNL